jgi:hypothetical protein
VYISEAEKYDKALVESWRSDMDGLLIFVGDLHLPKIRLLIQEWALRLAFSPPV